MPVSKKLVPIRLPIGSRVHYKKMPEYVGTVRGYITKDDDNKDVLLAKVKWDASHQIGIPHQYKVGRTGGYTLAELITVDELVKQSSNQPSLTEQLKSSIKKETTPRARFAKTLTANLTSRRSNTPAHHHIPGVVSVMNNKQATAFDQRYADYDPMILVAGRRKDVIASLEKVTLFRVNGHLVSRTHSPGDAVCMDGNITVDDEVQIDVSHKDDYRVVFFKF